MTTYTETVTVTHALRRSGLLGDDETPSSEQLALASKIYRSRIAGLQVRGFKLWGWTPDTVPEEYLDPLAEYIALFLIESAGGQKIPDKTVVEAMEFTLRQLSAIEPTGDVIAATYF